MPENYNTVQNPIPYSGFFTTKSLGEIQDLIESMPKSHRANLHMVMQFTLNSCHQLVEDNILNKEVFGG